MLRTITRGVSTGIGLAGEKYHDHKDRKTALAEQESKDVEVQVRELINPAVPGTETANDETIWALDEAAGPPSYETSHSLHRPDVERTVSDLVHDVTAISETEGHLPEAPTGKLPYPVIIPQRRPGTKARGWARAYPPDLEALGVEQDMFLRFLQNFEDAQQASPWLKALYVAGNAVGLVPGHITMAVSISISFAAGYVELLWNVTNTINTFQDCYRITRPIQGERFLRSDEQGGLNAAWPICHGPSVQRRSKQDW